MFLVQRKIFSRIAISFCIVLISGILINGCVGAVQIPGFNPDRIIHVYSIDGDLELADDSLIPVVGFARYDDNWSEAPEPIDWEHLSDNLTIPAPEIRVKKGEKIRLIHHNAGTHLSPKNSGLNHVTHTIHFHGLDLIASLDGVPGIPGNTPGVEDNDFYVYDFIPDFEGTYSYHCHVDTASHMALGMYGSFVVESDKPDTIYGYKYDREYTLLFSELDSVHNEVLRERGRYDMRDYKGDYYLLNGRIYMANLKNPLSTINDPKTRIVGKVGETILLRLLAFANDHTFVIHPHGYHMEVIGTDGRKLPNPYWKDTLPITSGERYDVLIRIGEKHKGLCTSCNIGAGISIIHDHNLRGVSSAGKYPQGALTIVEIVPDDVEINNGSKK